jgi:hypothetical protein
VLPSCWLDLHYPCSSLAPHPPQDCPLSMLRNCATASLQVNIARPDASPKDAGRCSGVVLWQPAPALGSGLKCQNRKQQHRIKVGKVHEEVVWEVRTSRQLTLKEFELCIGRSSIVQELMKLLTTATSSSTPTSKPQRKPKEVGCMASGTWRPLLCMGVAAPSKGKRKFSASILPPGH